MTERRVRVFYRLARDWPPGERDYVSLHARYVRRGGIPAGWDSYRRRTAQGLSAFDSASGAHAQWRQTPGRNRYLVRYEIPDDGGVIVEKTWGAGHWTLYGREDVLASFLDPEYCEILSEAAR